MRKPVIMPLKAAQNLALQTSPETQWITEERCRMHDFEIEEALDHMPDPTIAVVIRLCFGADGCYRLKPSAVAKFMSMTTQKIVAIRESGLKWLRDYFQVHSSRHLLDIA